MIIECPACNARFRLDEARIKGRGARVRCRRCGETIVALKPEEPREEEKSAGDDFLDLRSVVRETMGEKTAEPQPEPSCAEAPPEARDEVDTAFEGFLAPAKGEREESAPPKEEPRPAEEGSGAFPAGELAIEFRPEKKLELDLPVEPPAENLEPDFLRGGAGTLDISASLREEPQDFLIGTETPPAFEPPPPAASGQPLDLSHDIRIPAAESDAEPFAAQQGKAEAAHPSAHETRRTAPSSPRLSPSLIALVSLFVVLAGGGGYLGFTKGGQDILRSLIPGMESLWLRGAARTGPQYDVRNLIGYYEPNAAAGNLFVIKGQVANTGRTRKNGVRIHATLLDSKDMPILETDCYAGNMITGEALRTASRQKIEESLSNRFGDRLINMDIAPGKSVPFMVVFFNVPESISAYRLEAKDSN